MTTRTPLKSSTPEGISQMNQYIDDAVRMLAENCFCDVILLSSTAGSFLDGVAADNAHAEKLSKETGVKVITSAQCMLKALNVLNAKKISLITPSSEALNEAEYAYLESAGFEICSRGGFHLSDPGDILRVSRDEILKLAVKTEIPETDVVVISCSGLHVMDIIELMEKSMGKPVIASNQFGLWGALREIGVRDHPEGLGRLFAF